MVDPNITMEEYIRLEEEKSQRCGETFNCQTATFCRKGHYYEEEYFTNFKEKFSAIIFGKINATSFDTKQGMITGEYNGEDSEIEFSAIVLNNTLTSGTSPHYEPTVSAPNENKIDFRISLDESDDENYMVIYDENLFFYKIISVNDLKTDSKNDNDKVNMPLFLTPEPKVSYSNDLDFFKDFENKFAAIVYNDALTSKSDFLTEPTVIPQHIDEFNSKNETSLSECDEKEQNVLYFDLLPFNVIYPDDLKSDMDNDNDKIDIEQPSRDMSVIPSSNVINVDTQGSNKLLKTSHDTSNKIFKTETFIKNLNVKIMICNHLRNGMSFKNLYVPFGIPFDPKFFIRMGLKW
ncbi:hypothetical protein Tco_0891946 [Tanacetum coccineum]|uniref:Uncharacterized protein n=1 Tax=Tanacetum coccineum TaxID=301880 RepID=A0ABQ5C636_9ASTR